MKILVIAIRGLQASLLGAYGNHWVSTPAVDQLAADGVVFDFCHADAASPEGTRLSWRTGRMHLTDPIAPASSPDLLAILRQADVPTMLIHDVTQPLPESFLTGWSATVEVEATEEEDPLELALQGTTELLEALQEEPRGLVWLDLPTLLPPWKVPDEIVAPLFEYELVEEEAEADTTSEDSNDDDFEDEPEEEEVEEDDEEEEDLDLFDEDEQPPDYLATPPQGSIARDDDHLALSLRMSCGAAINFLDTGLEHLLRTLDEVDPDHQMGIVLTSDHGYPLGEHGVVGLEGARPHEELLHVPLILRLPGKAQAGRRVGELCQSVDLAATLADLFGVQLPDAHGKSLLPLIHGQTPAEIRPYSLSAIPGSEGAQAALRTPNYSFLLPLDPSPDGQAEGELYLQPEDPWEVSQVRQQHQELVEHVTQVLRQAIIASAAPGPLILPELLDEDDLLRDSTPEESDGE